MVGKKKERGDSHVPVSESPPEGEQGFDPLTDRVPFEREAEVSVSERVMDRRKEAFARPPVCCAKNNCRSLPLDFLNTSPGGMV